MNSVVLGESTPKLPARLAQFFGELWKELLQGQAAPVKAPRRMARSNSDGRVETSRQQRPRTIRLFTPAYASVNLPGIPPRAELRVARQFSIRIGYWRTHRL